MKNILIIAALILLPLTQAFGGATDNLFGEVSLGYDTSKIAATNVSGPNENATTSGFALTARAGYVYSIFLAGISIAGTAGSLNFDSPTFKNGSWNKAATYLFAGLDFGAVRVWGEYAVMDQMRLALDYSTYVTDKIYSGGTAYKLGVGVAVTKRLHLNAEYYVNAPNAMQNRTGQVNWTSTYSSWQESGYMFTIAYEFFGSEIHNQK